VKVRYFLAVGIVSLVSSTLLAQAPPKPGPEHAVLKEIEGTWDAVVKAGPQESKGTMTSKMMGGLWLISEFKGDFEGASFEGRGIDGYDVDKKKYIAIWVDSMTTSPLTLEGTYDEKSKTMSMQGEGKGPDGKPAKFKTTTNFPNKDQQVFKMFLVGPDGNDIPMMTIEYKRKK
jgi:hypothetical protein